MQKIAGIYFCQTVVVSQRFHVILTYFALDRIICDVVPVKRNSKVIGRLPENMNAVSILYHSRLLCTINRS